MNANYRKRVVVLLFILLLLRFWYCQTFELTGPEAYAWVKGRSPDWGYWDQGPWIPWLSWIGTVLYHPTELGVRWATANIYIVVGFLVFYLGRSWFTPRIGFFALLLYMILPLYAWQMLLLSEATLSVGFMALALAAFRLVLLRDSWLSWGVAGLVIALATTLDWWNLLWCAGFLLFFLLDPRRTGRFFSLKPAALLTISLLGLVPFVSFRWAISGFAGLQSDPWALLRPHQYIGDTAHFGTFFAHQLIWSGPLGILVVLAVLMIRRLGIPFLREYLLIICLPLPGLVAQLLLGLVGWPDEDVLAALWLPWLLILAVVVARLLDQGARWRAALLTLASVFLLMTLSRFWPASAGLWGERFAPAPRHQMANVAAELARAQQETGLSLLITDSPRDASLLNFYLPLQPFVYVVPDERAHTQYDLWSNYFESPGSSALFLTRRQASPPRELVREFAEVKPLHDVALGNSTWHLSTCQRLSPGEALPGGGAVPATSNP